MAAKLRVYPAYYRRVRYYRKWISEKEGRPQVAARFVNAVEAVVLDLLKNPGRGHSARFRSSELADVLRINVPGFVVFGLFYRWDGQTLTVISLEHTAQDLPSRLTDILSSHDPSS